MTYFFIHHFKITLGASRVSFVFLCCYASYGTKKLPILLIKSPLRNSLHINSYFLDKLA